MKFFLIQLLLSLSIFTSAQVLSEYPSGQSFYKGGEVNFLSDFQKNMLEDQIQACENPKEKYLVKFVVYADGKISYVKDFDTINIAKNKCAFDVARKVFPKLKNFTPAQYLDAERAAITSVEINPTRIKNLKFSKDRFGTTWAYDVNNAPAIYNGDVLALRKKLAMIFGSMIDNFFIDYVSVTVKFNIDEYGVLNSPQIVKGELREDAKKFIFKRILKLKNIKPATKDGKDVKSEYTFPFTMLKS